MAGECLISSGFIGSRLARPMKPISVSSRTRHVVPSVAIAHALWPATRKPFLRGALAGAAEGVLGLSRLGVG